MRNDNRGTPDFLELCKKLRPVIGDKIDKLYVEYSIAEDDIKKREIYQIVFALYSRYVDNKVLDGNVLLKVPPHGLLHAEYELGRITYPNRPVQSFCLRERDWVRHVCITGMSGAGKTTFAIRILKSFIDKNKPFIAFDWKRNFRQILLISPKTLVFTVGKRKASNLFRLNINKPPKGVEPDEWITVLCDLICESYGASHGVHKLLSEALDKAFKTCQVYNGGEDYPTWFHIRDALDKMVDKYARGREAEWLMSAQRIAHSLTFGEFGLTINDTSKHNMTIEELLSSQTVFELDSLGAQEKKFFCSYLLLSIYKTKKALSTRTENSFATAIIVDEAHNIFLKQKMSFVQESVTDMVYREIREYGIGLVCLDQHASMLSETVLGNSSTMIAFQQVLPQDVECISRLMFLYDDKQIFTRLGVGNAVVRLVERFHDPFLMKVEKVAMPDAAVSDDYIREAVKEQVLYKKRLKVCRDSMDTEKLALAIAGVAQEENPHIPNTAQNDIAERIALYISRSGSIKSAKKHFLDEGFTREDVNIAFKRYLDSDEGKKVERFLASWKSFSHNTNINSLEALRILQYLQKSGTSTTAQLYKETNLSTRKGNDLKNSLYELGLIEICGTKTSTGLKKEILLSRKGINLMERLGSTA